MALWQNIKPCKCHAPYWIALAAVMGAFLMVWNQREAQAMLVQQVLLALVLLAAPASCIMKKGRKKP